MQIQKDEVRERIVDAALSCFAEKGHAKTTIKAVADSARVSVGNVYRYFEGKEELLRAALPESKVEGIEKVLLRRLLFFTHRGDANARSGPDAENLFKAQIESLVTQRREIAFLFTGAAGSRWEGFSDRMAESLAAAFLAWARSFGSAPPKEALALARALYLNLFRLAANAFSGPVKDLQKSLYCYIDYHVAGMTALALRWRDKG